MAKSKKRSNGSTHHAAGTKKPRPATENWQKDQEEIDLEAKLFGTSKLKKAHVGRAREDDVDEEMEEMEDDDLFQIDAPELDLPSEEEDGDEQGELERSDEDDDEHSVDDDEEDEVEDDDDGDSAEDDESEELDDESIASNSTSMSSQSAASITFDDTPAGPSSSRQPTITSINKSKSKKEDQVESDEPRVEFPADLQTEIPSRKKKSKGIWTDPSDELITVNVDASRRTKKLGRGKGDPTISGVEFEKRLRAQFESLHPRPEWAYNRIATGTPTMKLLLSSTKSFISTESLKPLPSGKLEIQRMLDANHQNPTTNRRTSQGAGKGVVDVAWHPNPKVGVMAVSGGDRRVRFFNIDGHTNPTLLTIHLPSLPLTKSTFHPSGSSLLLAGTRPYYYTYDLPSARCIRSPRNLFGSQPDATAPNSLTRHAFSPDGTMLAVAGRRGAVSILDWSGVGVGAVIADLRSGRGGSVAAMVWNRESTELSVLGGRDGSEVEVWHVGERRVVRKWKDDRAFGGTTMELSPNGEYTAVGASTGIVNVYSSSSLSTPISDPSQHILPTPIKSLGHLTTQIVSTAFHPKSEMLMTASNTKKGQVRVYHLPSGSAFSNWPTKTTPLGRVSNVSFAPGGEFLATGSERGHVLLYNIKHYSR